MKADVVHIRASPNRANIYLYKLNVGSDLSCFRWLLDTLIEKNQDTPKTIIYCRRQKDCGQLFCHFLQELGDGAYLPFAAKISVNCLLGMYHANTLNKHKNRVINELLNEGGVCRVVFATTALGMGINIPNIRYVVHYGPPREVDDFMQEIGRGGRDGDETNALMFYNGVQLRNCDKAMKSYVKSENVCLRQIILNQFEETNVPNQGTHKCCMVCHKLCKCEGETCAIPLLSFQTSKPPNIAEVNEQPKKRTVSFQEKELLKELLTHYQKMLASKCPSYYLSSESCTGFTDAVLSSTVKKCKFIFTLDDVVKHVQVYTRPHAVEILLILNEIFDDIDISTELQYECTQPTLPKMLDYDIGYGGDDYPNSSCESACSDSESDTSVTSGISGINDLHV